MKKIIIKDEFIKLGQVLKLCGIANNGVEAKILISESKIKVNGEIENKRGKKIYINDIIKYKEKKYQITN